MDEGIRYVSLRELLRRDGVEKGARIRLPEGAEKAEFWDRYPKDEAEFRRYVIPISMGDEGIVYCPDRDLGHGPRELQEEYRGFARQEVARYCFLWRSDRVGFEARHPRQAIAAIEDYLADRAQREGEEKAWKAAEDERCRAPTPPVGYRWEPAPAFWGHFGILERYVLVGDRDPKAPVAGWHRPAEGG